MHQTSTTFTDWQAALRLQGHASWQNIPTSPNRPVHLCRCPSPPPLPQLCSKSQHPLVERTRPLLEWHCPNPGAELDIVQLYKPIHRCICQAWFWSLLQWCLVERPMAAAPQINNSPKISIAWQELYAIMVAAMAWGHLWYGQHILFHCDNLAVVDIWRKHSSKIPYIMCLIRNLYFIAASNHFHVCVFHIQGVNNTIADALSRNKTHHLLVPGPKYRKNHDSRSKACISALTREATAWANNSLAHQQPASTPQQTDTRSNSATNYTSTHIQPPKTFCLFSHVT